MGGMDPLTLLIIATIVILPPLLVALVREVRQMPREPLRIQFSLETVLFVMTGICVVLGVMHVIRSH